MGFHGFRSDEPGAAPRDSFATGGVCSVRGSAGPANGPAPERPASRLRTIGMIGTLKLLAVALTVYHLGCGPCETPTTSPGDFESSSRYEVDPDRVPESLRHLVPLARQWGIGDDVERMEFIERSSAADRDALADALDPHHADITAWLDSFEPGEMPDEAAAFMYMQLALEEIP